MDPVGQIVLVFAVFIFGALFGWLASTKIRRGKMESAEEVAQQIVISAKDEAEDLKKTAVLEAKDDWRKEREVLERELEGAKHSQRQLETSLHEREQQLDRKVDVLESKERSLGKSEVELSRRESQIVGEESRVAKLVQQQQEHLEEVAGITRPEARKRLIDQLEESARQFAGRKVKEIKDHAIANGNREAREIIVNSIERFSAELAMENTISVIQLPSDEMKGRIIGRDGRNIRSFEMISGVEIVVDDTPGMVMLSGFDPLRREVAKNTLEKLIVDGRIHPGRIEEVYEKAREDVEELIRESGSKAAFDLGIHDLDERLLEMLGRLRFRTSYGQNLLTHSKEVGFLAGMMAEKLGLDPALARRAGLLHDIGQALDYEVGTDIEQDGLVFVRKCGEGQELLEILEMYDQKTPKRSALAALVGAANEISTHRPGAQREKAEDYIRRLKQIEEIAMQHHGVRRAFALQNGREVRILVDSAIVDDAYGDQLADTITQKLEEELDQPGQIKLCLIREVRAVHYAR